MSFSVSSFLPLAVRLSIGKILFPSNEPAVVRVGLHRIIKGPCHPSEIEAMQYVAEHTSIPVPEVHATHQHDGHLYIEMEFIKGIDLASAWMKDGYLSDNQKESIIKDVQGYIAQLRQLNPPKEDVVCSALGHATQDCRIGSHAFGPLSHEDFHGLLRGRLNMEDCAIAFGENAVKVHTQSYRSHFTHADLIPRNIIVQDGRVAAIIDWAFSGWYPEYWEYTKAHYDLFPLQDWYARLYKDMPRYDDELAAERSLWRNYSEPGNVYISHGDGDDTNR